MAVLTRAARGGEAGSGDPPVFDLDGSASGRSGVRWPEVALGILVVVGSALVALWWQTRAYPTSSVLVAAQAVERGRTITMDDLGVVELQSREPVAVVAADQSDSVVGRIALIDIEPGSVLSPTMMAEVSDIGPDEAVVGLFVKANQIPSVRIGVGSVLTVLDSTVDRDSEGSVLAERAEVVDVEPGNSFGEMLVSVRVTREVAPSVALGGAGGTVVLVELGES